MIYRQRAAILNIFSVFVTAQMIHAQTSQIREYVYLGGKVVGIESPPPPLIVTSLSATKKTFSTSTDSGSLTVTTNGAAPWRVTNIPTWISVTTGSYPCAGGGTDWCGTGTATIPLSVQANTSGTARMTRFKIVDPSSIPEVLVSQAASGISSPIVLSGSVPTAGPGQQRFEFVIHNPSGAANINFVQIIARRTWTTTDACFIHYTHGTGGHEVGLASDETFSNVPSIPYWVAFGTVGTGSSTPISNRQCTISPNDVSTINDGNLLILLMPITPTVLMEGTNQIWLLAGNSTGQHNNWNNMAPIQSWSPYPGASPVPTYSMSPTSGFGLPNNNNAKNFDFTFNSSGPGGYRHIETGLPLINFVYSGNQACWVQFYPSRKTIALINDDVNALMPPGEVRIGTAVTMENTHCYINAGSSSAVELSSSSILLRLNVGFKTIWQGQTLGTWGASLRRSGDYGDSTPMKGSWTVGSCDANALLDLQPTSATVPAGTTKQFNAYLDAPPILNNNGVTWQLTGVGSISSTGVYSAPSAAPTTSQSATVKATYTKTVSGCGSSDVTKTSTVTIPAACAVQSLVVTPNILYNIYPGAPPIQFQAFANGSTVPLASGITWTSSAPTYASINSTGIMTLGQVANQLQIVTITATSTCGGVSATAQVQLSYFPIPQGAQLTPNSGYGAGQQFLFTRGTQPPNPVDGTITDILYSSDLSVTTNACYIVYAYGGLQLRDNTGGYSSFAPGNNNSQLPTGNPPPSHLSGSAVNSQCTLNYYDAFTLSTFVERWWNIPLVFNHSFAGPRKIYVRVGQDSPFVQVGGWNVP